MTFINAGTLGTVPDRRDEVVALLTRRDERLRDLGCLAYEVGTNDEDPDTVYVMEVWQSAEAHQASLQDTSVASAIQEARPLLNGEFGGFRFEVSGSPLRGSDDGSTW
ncbi:antibiotic biosynthesis monooxygenase [Brachybacterium endophyticum]|uniref:Antibiotic biosynthesis monooxygenase n=1 Tax=Brachybacterium endophyticum TaxID=2182385 RepID=A0A2U2RM99_9MICO|nr:antibiotic biosynthesis monooxygenase [Brachybacterium endophyticum]PWH06993.1 antibiotic biosynthesis monooxygenase [Brachybacterium endophyticum]